MSRTRFITNVLVQIKVVLFSTYLLSISFELAAQEQTFVREYTYRASEVDSKNSCRVIATNQLRTLLLNEIGVYVQSESILTTSDVSGQFSQDFVENIATISAAITKLEVLDEKWDGETFWMKAKITVDGKSLEESLKQIIQDKQKLKELDEAKLELQKTRNELDRLRKEITINNTSIDPAAQELRIQKYNNEIRALESSSYILSGRKKYWTKDYHGALDDFNRAIELAPKGDTYRARGDIRQSLNDYLGALSDYDIAISLNPGDALTYYKRGSVNSFLKRYEKAMEDFTAAIKLNKLDIASYYSRGNLKQQIEDFDESISDYTKAIELVEGDLVSDDFSFLLIRRMFKETNNSIYVSRGLSKHLIKDNKGAILDFSKALLIDPSDAPTYLFRGRAKAVLGDYRGSIEDATRNIELAPSSEAYNFRAQLKTALEDDRGAIADYTKAIDIDPLNVSPYEGRGGSRYILKDYEGAISDFSNVIKLSPNSGRAYYFRGLSKSALRNYSGCSDLKKAIELEYNDAYDAMHSLCN